jgi:hypothetical protein
MLGLHLITPRVHGALDKFRTISFPRMLTILKYEIHFLAPRGINYKFTVSTLKTLLYTIIRSSRKGSRSDH